MEGIQEVAGSNHAPFAEADTMASSAVFGMLVLAVALALVGVYHIGGFAS